MGNGCWPWGADGADALASMGGQPQIGAVTVSPFGRATSVVPISLNNNANFGPDTPGTVTSGIQEAVNYAIAQAQASGNASAEVVLLPGKFTLSAFTNTTTRSAITIDAGYAITAGTPIAIRIRGALPAGNSINGTSYEGNYPLGGTVIDASALDVLQYGLFKQGRVFLVPPYAGTNAPTNAIQLTIEDLTVIVPTYNSTGTGSPSYTLGGYGAMKLFVSGNTVNTAANHFQFVSGIDAWAASQCQVKNVQVLSSIAAYNSSGSQYAGGGGVLPYGSAAGLVMPAGGNQGIITADNFSTYDVAIGLQCAAHTTVNQLNVNASNVGIYTREGGHGSYFISIKVQQTAITIQHLLLAQLTTTISGHTVWDPVGDLYAVYGGSFPSAAQTSSITIGRARIENIFTNFLVDDPSNPLTVVAAVDFAGSVSEAAWGSGANLIVNFIDAAANSQTTVTGTTAGTAVWTQQGVTPWDKRVVVTLTGYENTTGTAQTITFRNAYNSAPAILHDDSGGATVSATTLTLPASMGSAKTGYIILEGY